MTDEKNLKDTIEYALGSIQATLEGQRRDMNETRVEQHIMSQKMDALIVEVASFKARQIKIQSLEDDVSDLKSFRTFAKGVMLCVSAFCVFMSFAFNLPDRVVKAFFIPEAKADFIYKDEKVP